ncbi:hypothetical protein ATC04_18280 (plasmid) [Arthrobacter sp. YC-RL1]|uniref:hypothetical protein n=1 Tax=Arthrobacter sp. YC-RL1 TaxID=1652545 RepID=UPI0007214CB9|nr:hypothetical protein [Arthrobacter sp. YC-RL1]ALQ32659.1 hypothetical protein ATC04_18280 [Arthrobacter sp. YC-RL1]
MIKYGGVPLNFSKHLVPGTEFRQEAFADLTENLDAVTGADFGAAKCFLKLRSDVRVIQFALGGLNDDAASTEFDQHVYHLMLVLKVVCPAKIDEDPHLQ